MTRIEKEIISAALSEYAFNHQKEADRAASEKDYSAKSLEHARVNIAMTILAYWREVEKEPCGSVKI